METTDLTELRRIAEEGRNLPMLGGAHFILWGSALPLAALYHWLLMSGYIDMPYWTLTVCWFGMAAIAGLLSNLLARRQRTRMGTETLANRVERGVWQAAGAMFAIIALGLATHAAVFSTDPRAWSYFALLAPITFGVYGIAIKASAVSARADWLKPYIFLSFALTAITALMVGSIWLYLIFTLGIAALSLSLGVDLLRRERG